MTRSSETNPVCLRDVVESAYHQIKSDYENQYYGDYNLYQSWPASEKMFMTVFGFVPRLLVNTALELEYIYITGTLDNINIVSVDHRENENKLQRSLRFELGTLKTCTVDY